jgi:hypothetical protein
MTRIKGTLHEYHYTFTIKSRLILRMRNISDRNCITNQKKCCVFNNFFYENRVAYEIMWKNVVQLGKPQLTTRRMRIECCIPKATDSHSE